MGTTATNSQDRSLEISKQGVAVAAAAGVGIVAMSAFLFRERLFGLTQDDEEQTRPSPPDSMRAERPRGGLKRSTSSFERAKDFVASLFKSKPSAKRNTILKGVMFVGVTATIHRFGHLMSV